MNYFVHETSLVKSKNIGERTKVWDFCNILEGARIGKNCNICHGCFIEDKVIIGDNVTIKNNVSVWDGMEIEDNVFIGPDVSFSNDKYPRSKNINFKHEKTLLKRGCSIGANATILPGIEIGEYAMVGAGSVVTKNVSPYSVVHGNPAVLRGTVNKEGETVERAK